MKFTIEVDIGSSYILPVDKKALKTMITNWAKIYGKVEPGFYPSIKIRVPDE